jgi:anaphase-promoting complex subunit 3
LSLYKCKEAIAAFKQLPQNQQQSGWVLIQVGRAYFELVDYTEAQRVFELVRKLEKYRVEGMEIYSTILWHLRKESQLSYLAHELVEIDKMAPQTWCVVGNCFSLQKEHETALKFFQRVSSFSFLI